MNNRNSKQVKLLRICRFFIYVGLMVSVFLPPAVAQNSELLSVDKLKKLSLEELMSLEVTSVSKRSEKLTEVASAIQVITGEDIRRSGATSIPEALRLAVNLQVAQLNSYATIISARGFNAVYSNKLLVMIDGRTVYSPHFAGTLWDVQNLVMEDIDRIEVISGPGGTLWEANAVNGVINIITKSAGETGGIYASVAAGTFLENKEVVRYGGKIGSNLDFRIYGLHFDRGNTFLPENQDNNDQWGVTQGGFRIDWRSSSKDLFIFQADVYGGREKTSPESSLLDGQNFLGRWKRTFSSKSQAVLQFYYDRTWRRDVPSTFTLHLNTYDLDFQHRLILGKKHDLLWGLGYRNMVDETLNSTEAVGFVPQKRNMHLVNAFIQDEITIVPQKVKFTLGTKLLHNVFTDFEVQPSARLTWTPNAKHTLWAAVSRAVRTPSRIDIDYHLPTTPVPADQPHVAGGPDFVSEKVIAYETGYRVQPGDRAFLSLAAFYNVYDDLYSVEALPGTQIYQIQNGTEGTSWGAELSGTYRVFKNWRIRGGYTYFGKDLDSKPGHSFDHSILGYDAENRFLLQSMLDLPLNFQFDVVAWYTDRLPGIVPDYFTFDARLAWMYRHWELAVVGQNLWKDRHREFSFEIPRGIYGKISWRYNK